MLGSGEERPALVDARHLINEPPQGRAVVEHERVYTYPHSGHALHFLERLERGPRRESAEEHGQFDL